MFACVCAVPGCIPICISVTISICVPIFGSIAHSIRDSTGISAAISSMGSNLYFYQRFCECSRLLTSLHLCNYPCMYDCSCTHTCLHGSIYTIKLKSIPAHTQHMQRSMYAIKHEGYSTVTDFAKLRGWSTSQCFKSAISRANNCNGTLAVIAEKQS